MSLGWRTHQQTHRMNSQSPQCTKRRYRTEDILMCGGIAMRVFGLHTQGLKGATRKILHIEMYIVCI